MLQEIVVSKEVPGELFARISAEQRRDYMVDAVARRVAHLAQEHIRTVNGSIFIDLSIFVDPLASPVKRALESTRFSYVDTGYLQEQDLLRRKSELAAEREELRADIEKLRHEQKLLREARQEVVREVLGDYEECCGRR